MDRVRDKIAIVTGGALGLGAAAARPLAREGAKVVITDIKDSEGEAVAKSIAEAGGKALYLHHDVASEDEWKSVIQRTIKEFGRLDVLVNNAGVGVGAPPEEQTLEQWRWLMSINLDGVFLSRHEARPPRHETAPAQGRVDHQSLLDRGTCRRSQSGRLQRLEGGCAALHQVGGALLRQFRA